MQTRKPDHAMQSTAMAKGNAETRRTSVHQCKPVIALPADDKWTFEIKFDGYRCVAVKLSKG
jgi:ATP-dependent DNA ligase